MCQQKQEQSVERTLREEPIRFADWPDPVCVAEGTALEKVVEALQANNAGCVVVCRGKQPVGIFTERDYLYKVAGLGADPTTPIDQFMSKNLKTLRPEDRLQAAIRLMTTGGYRHIPLLNEKGELTGLISARHIVDYIVEHFPAEVGNLPPHLHQAPKEPEGA